MDLGYGNLYLAPEPNGATCVNSTTHDESASICQDGTAAESGNTRRNGSARKNGTVRKNRVARKSKTLRRKNVRRNGGGDGGGQGGGGIPVANWDPECRRGAIFLNMDARSRVVPMVDLDDDEFNAVFRMSNDNSNDLEEPNPIHEKQILGPTAQRLLLKIEASCKTVLSNSGQCEAFKIVKSLVHGLQLENINTAFYDNSLLSLIHRCGEAELKVSQAVFIQILNFIHLRAKFERFVFRDYSSVTTDEFFLQRIKDDSSPSAKRQT